MTECGHRQAEDGFAWMDYAECLGMSPNLFYDDEPGSNYTAAKTICHTCPVEAECLAAALATPPLQDFGVWGGTAPRERRKLRHNPTARAAAFQHIQQRGGEA